MHCWKQPGCQTKNEWEKDATLNGAVSKTPLGRGHKAKTSEARRHEENGDRVVQADCAMGKGLEPSRNWQEVAEVQE